MKKQGFIGLPILIAIVLGLVVVGGGAYFVMQKNSASQGEVATSTPQATVSGSAQIDTGLKTYTNSQYGFSVDYPSSMFINDTQPIPSYRGNSGFPFFPNNLGLTVVQLSLFKHSSSDETSNMVAIGATANPSVVATCGIFDLASAGITAQKNIAGEDFLYNKIVGEYKAGPEPIHKRYKVLRNNICYEIVENIYYTGKPELDTHEGFLQREAQLDSAVSSFRFTTPRIKNEPVLSIKSILPPSFTISYSNLPLANIRLKNESGQYVGKDIVGSEGNGTMTITIPAVQFTAGTYSAEAVETEKGVVVAKSAPRYITNRTNDLYLGYKGLKFPPIATVPQNVARSLCGIVFENSCAWGDMFINYEPFYVFGSVTNQPTLSILSPDGGEVLTMGRNYTISFTNDPVAGRYRVYLIHKNLIGEVNEVHQLHIVNIFENGQENIVTDFNEESLDENDGTHITPVQSGSYELMVVNVDTGVEGRVSGYVHVRPINYIYPTTTLKPYAVNTPLINSYWDGRGVFMNGGAGEDTLEIVGKRSDVVVYRGVDMPDQNQYDVVVFFRRTDNVVTVMTNVEIVKFDDQTIRTADLISQLRQVNH